MLTQIVSSPKRSNKKITLVYE